MAGEKLASHLEFRPRYHVDPVPWPYLIDILDRRQILEIAKVQVSLHRDMLQAQLRATEQVEKIIAGAK
jgi:hypothetical protein